MRERRELSMAVDSLAWRMEKERTLENMDDLEAKAYALLLGDSGGEHSYEKEIADFVSQGHGTFHTEALRMKRFLAMPDLTRAEGGPIRELI